MKTGILGGTFDPIHQGHLRLAEAARSQYGLNRILFVPALVSPHKAGKVETAPAPHRFRMVELAIKKFPEFELSDMELNRPGISYTVDTLRDLKKKYPKDEFYFILGSDAARGFSQWKEPEEIKKMVKLLVACRPGFALPEKSGGFLYLEMPETDLSSSHLRERLAKKEKLGAEIMPSDVESYIREMGLYSK